VMSQDITFPVIPQSPAEAKAGPNPALCPAWSCLVPSMAVQRPWLPPNNVYTHSGMLGTWPQMFPMLPLWVQKCLCKYSIWELLVF
jgi:hypothetical protein